MRTLDTPFYTIVRDRSGKGQVRLSQKESLRKGKLVLPGKRVRSSRRVSMEVLSRFGNDMVNR